MCGSSHAIYSIFPCLSCSELPQEGGGEPAPGGLTDADLESNWDEAIETFDAMDLPDELLRGIYSYGFEKPSAIQQRAIKPAMLGKDLIAQAQSGTVGFFLVLNRLIHFAAMLPSCPFSVVKRHLQKKG